jgi:8-oxo-dGTP diphosphatase
MTPPQFSALPTYPVTANRRYPAAPLVGVAAAIFDPAGRILLVQRARPPRAGSWGLPGGLLDLGEQLVEGARREVWEECAIDVAIRDLVAAFEPMERDEEGRIEYHYVVLDYWGEWRSGVAQAQDDAAAVAWVAIDQLADFSLAPDTFQVIMKAHAAWQHAQELTNRRTL